MNLGVAGAQHGARSCGGGAVGVCNLINGIGCNSRFLNDINSRFKLIMDFKFPAF